MMTENASERLFQSLQDIQHDYESSLPPVEKWNPELNGDLDMRIDREGQWFYQGGKLTRPAMVKMFSSILKREGDDYFLVTPVEKWRITVDVAPFVMLSLRTEEEKGQQGVVLTSNVGNDVLIGPENPFWIESGLESTPLPMMMVRNGLPGLLSRNVFYELVELCSPVQSADGKELWTFESAGETYSVGSIE
ncbi:DUF1285 domain-containing protein [Aestuariicella sp. G3-2]|uniref:DUF1285 domain-containing protein n=1 Tax=Pseudomaricurvus albidus TaxID=2842452 RepID=UPI001C0BE323|nr:DUF1285 domain-containing protein [Aestuariicella albida]MBU3070552.1 DUF1285 domain-containing protein [Aestuariicella albida]